MGRRWDLSQVARVIVMTMTSLLALLLLFTLSRFSESYQTREIAISRQAIENALVECYAMEGSYPSDIAYLEKYYGIVLNRNAYVYALDNAFSESYMQNIRPQVIIVSRREAVNTP